MTVADTKDSLHIQIPVIYKQKPKQAVPMTCSMRNCLDDADAKLQDCFAGIDWNMFWHSSDGIEEYTTTVTGFINKCIDDIVPTLIVRTYPNQKPWILFNITNELNVERTLSRNGTLKGTLMRNPAISLRRTINQAKRQYRTKIESYYSGSDARWIWQGLQTIIDLQREAQP
jgi:hypothetical protein